MNGLKIIGADFQVGTEWLHKEFGFSCMRLASVEWSNTNIKENELSKNYCKQD